MPRQTGDYPFNPATGEDWPVEVYQEKIAELQAERDDLSRRYSDTLREKDLLEVAVEELKAHFKWSGPLQAERDRLQAALKEYGRHHADCPAWFAPYNGTCDCGLREALNKADTK